MLRLSALAPETTIMTSSPQPLNVLFLCTHNSARSILAEALLNDMAPGRFHAYSAGSSPRDNQQPNPLGLEVLRAAGISTEGLRSKSWDEFAAPGAPVMDLIITVCDNAAGEVCPIWPGHPATAHWGYADPSAGEGTDDEKREAFRKTLHAIHQRLELLINLPADKLEKTLLQHTARELSRAADTPYGAVRTGRRASPGPHERVRTLPHGVGALCIVVGIALGQFLPGVFQAVGRMEIAQVNLPVGVLIWVMVIPMLVKVDFGALGEVRKHIKGIGVTLFVNWLVKPFSMALLGWLFIRHWFAPDAAADQLDSYIAGLILLAAAPCTAMVFVWSRLTGGDPLFTLSQVALNDSIMVVAFAPLVGVAAGHLGHHRAVGHPADLGGAVHRHSGDPGPVAAQVAAGQGQAAFDAAMAQIGPGRSRPCC
jgi:arsenate reductase